jgi:hypothetical protein
MLRSFHRHGPAWFGLVGAVGALVTVSTLSGCPGSLDPALLAGNGGGSGGGGTSGGAGGASAMGGSGGTAACANPDMAVTTNCASATCHDSTTKEAGLDLTPGAGVAARLVGITSSGGGDSVCGGNAEAYLNANSNPPTGLVIDKMTQRNPPCGSLMPFGNASLLPTATLSCIEQWAEGVISGTAQ